MIKKIKAKLEENDKIVIKNITGAFVVKGLAMLVSFFSFPAYKRFFNDDTVLGFWFTLLSILTWLLSIDFGIGNGLRNKLVLMISRKDKEGAKKYISSAYIMLGGIVLMFLTIVTPIILIVNWGYVLQIPIDLISEKTLILVVMVVYLTVIIQFFLRLINFILYALQKSAVNNLLLLITTTIQFLFVLIYKGTNNEHNLIILSIVHMICVLLPLIITTIIIFSTKLKDARPNFRFFDYKKGKEVLTLGGKFFWVQIMYVFLTVANSFLISNILSPDDVVEYQTYFKIFTLVGTITTLALTPFWSAVTKAKEEENWLWIKKYFRLFTIGIVIILFGQLTLVPLTQIIFNVWLQDQTIKVNYIYALIFALFGSTFAIHGILATFANGFNKIKPQLVIYTAGVIMKLIILYGIQRIVVNWSIIVLIDFTIFALYCIIDYFVLNRYITNKINKTNELLPNLK